MKIEEKTAIKPILDGHGYEIFRLESVKSKKEKIDILKKHITWTENKHTEVLHELKDMLNELL